MFDKIRKMASEQLSTTAEVDAFMNGFEKAALLGLTPDMINTAGEAAFKGIGGGVAGLGVALLGAGIVKSVSSGANAVGNYQLRSKFEAALAQVTTNNKIVKGARPEKARDYAETLFKFAPHVASDPNLLSSILANAVLGEGVDPQTIRTLVDLERGYNDNNSNKPFVGLRV